MVDPQEAADRLFGWGDKKVSGTTLNNNVWKKQQSRGTKGHRHREWCNGKSEEEKLRIVRSHK